MFIEKIKQFFNELLKVFNKLDVINPLPEENVLLHIRARGLIKMSRFGILRAVVLGFPITKLVELLFLPLTIYKNLIGLIISFTVSIIIYLVFNLDINNLIIIFLLILILTNLNSFSNWFKCFLFDLFDIITLSSCPKLWLKIYFSKTNSHGEWLEKFKSPLNLHIYQTRQLWRDKIIQNEEDVFLNEILKFSKERDIVLGLVRNYWSKFTITDP